MIVIFLIWNFVYAFIDMILSKKYHVLELCQFKSLTLTNIYTLTQRRMLINWRSCFNLLILIINKPNQQQ